MAQDHPVTALFGRYFSVRTDRRKIDHRWNTGELEHLQRDAVIDFLLMPERIRNVEREIMSLQEDVSAILATLEKVLEAQKDFVVLHYGIYSLLGLRLRASRSYSSEN